MRTTVFLETIHLEGSVYVSAHELCQSLAVAVFALFVLDKVDELLQHLNLATPLISSLILLKSVQEGIVGNVLCAASAGRVDRLSPAHVCACMCGGGSLTGSVRGVED